MDTQLQDKQEIYEVVMRYCRGADRLDMELMRSTYHDDGVDHHTGFSGPVAEYIVWVEKALKRFSGTMHIVGNHMCEINGDIAVAESYGTAVHWGEPPDDPRRNFTSGFRYVDHMAKRNGRWGIVERWAVREWTRSDAGLHMVKEGVGPSPSRDANDPVLRLRQTLGFNKTR